MIVRLEERDSEENRHGILEGVTEEGGRKLYYSVFRPRFELGTCRMKCRRFNTGLLYRGICLNTVIL